ncbi:MAG TPA: methyltransferase domain-containing protein [Acidimicrobiales bacterium]|nr:methyltransferase domain-containing protein [Acidimicrobiales bacterium]
MDTLAEARERQWYHTMELTPDFVTRGWFDMRPYVSRYGIPERLDGKRALDVGTFDGFWAFELERRGAEVVSLDIDDERDLDWPPRRRPTTFSDEPRGRGFHLAKEIMGSKVERVSMSIYHATPEELGTFDLVFAGSCIMHLRDQLLAFERIANLCSDMFISAEEYDRLANLSPVPVARYLADRDKSVVFWLPSAKTWRALLWTAGFDRVEQKGRFVVTSANAENRRFRVPHVVHHAFKR